MQYNGIKNALSVDIEDWYQAMIQINHKDWSKYKFRLKPTLNIILETFKMYNIKATFFILGYVAENHPDIVELIAQAGHEIACHGYFHVPIYKQTPQEFRNDVLRAKTVIESITKGKLKGYRAPYFSINKDCLWALDILYDLGFEYDSSVFPTRNFLYGIPDAPQTIYRINKTGILEFPLSVLKIMNFNLPICGGFYLRVLPYTLTEYGIRYFNNRGWPAIVYMHPWELDVTKPKIPMQFKWRIIHEYNISKMEGKFKRLIKNFQFASINEVIFGK